MRLLPRPWWGKLLALVAVLGWLLLLGTWYLTSTGFWQWLGWRLVAAAQDRLNGDLQVSSISGNLVTGMSFRDLQVRRGEEILTLEELRISLSFWSLLRLEPVIGTLTLQRPVVTLRQGTSGTWNVSGLLKKRPPPPFHRLHIRQIAIQAGTVRLLQPGQEQVFQDVELNLGLTILSPGRPEAIYKIAARQLVFTCPPWPRLQLAARLTISPQTLELAAGQLELAGQTVAELQGVLTRLPEPPTLKLHGQLLPLGREVLKYFWPNWPPDLIFQGDLTLQGSLAALELTGQGRLNTSPWSLVLQWQNQNGGNFRASITGQQLSPTLLARLAGIPLTEATISPLSGQVELFGCGYPWQGDWRRLSLELEPFTWRQAKVNAAKLVLDRSQPQEKASLQLAGNFGRAVAKLQGRFLPSPAPPAFGAGTLQLQVQDCQPQLLIGPQAPSANLSGVLDGTFRLPFQQWRQLEFAGKLQLRGRLQELAFQELAWTGAWTGRRLEILKSRLLLTPNNQVTARGWLDPQQLDLDLNLALQLPLPGFKLTAASRGQVRGQAKLKGLWSALSFQVAASGAQLGWSQLQAAALQAQIQGQWQKTRLTLDQVRGKITDLTTPWGQCPVLKLQGQGRGQALAFELVGQLAPERQAVLRGSCSWEATTIQLQLLEGLVPLGSQELKLTSPATLTSGPGRVGLTPLQLQWGAARLNLHGQIEPDRLSGQAQVVDLPLDQLPKSFLPVPVSGRLQLELAATGSPGAPSLTGKVIVKPGQMAGFAFAALTTNLRYQDQLVHLQADLEEKPTGVRLTLQGQLPLLLSFRPWRWQPLENKLHLHLTSERLDFNLLPALTSQISQASGPLNLNLQVTGTWSNPQVTGSLGWAASSIRLRAVGVLLQLAPGALNLTPGRLELPPVLIHSGKGQARLQGGAKLGGLWPQEANFTLQLNNAQIINRDGSQAAVSGQLQLQGSWPTFQLQGHLTATDGQFRLGFFQSTQRSDIIILPRPCRYPSPEQEQGRFQTAAVVQNFAVKLVLDLPGGIWIRDKEVKAEIEGRITINRQPRQPFYFGGSLRAKQGTLLMVNKVFNLDQAILTFPNEPHKPITLEARASRSMDDIQLILVANGPVTNLRTRLESNPPLPPRDLLSLMVFDRVAGKMTREEYLTISQRAMGLIGGFTMERLKALLGGSLPLVGELSPASSQNGVGVGKKLGKDITLSYERKLSPLPGEDVNQVRLNYRLNKYLSAETQLGRRNPGGDLFFNLDF